jgi:glycerol-3-phosphate acyltransferase PlsY
MNASLVLLAAVTGYLLGAISFARIVVRLKTGQKVAAINLTTPDGGGRLVSHAVSASAVRLQLGPRYGILVGVLDILKAFLPTLVFAQLWPDQPYFLSCAAASPFGHNWPIYYRFRGGNGQAVILGGMLAIDWVGALVTNGTATLLGLTVLKDGLIGDIGGIPLLLPWMGWRYGLLSPYMAYAVAVNVAFWVSFLPTLKQYLALKRGGHLPTAEDSVVMFNMDYRFMRRLAPRTYAEVDKRAAERDESSTRADGGK